MLPFQERTHERLGGGAAFRSSSAMSSTSSTCHDSPQPEQRDIRKAEVWGGPADEAPTLLRCSGCGESWHVEDVELIADDDLKAAPPPKRSCVLSWKGSMASAAE